MLHLRLGIYTTRERTIHKDVSLTCNAPPEIEDIDYPRERAIREDVDAMDEQCFFQFQEGPKTCHWYRRPFQLEPEDTVEQERDRFLEWRRKRLNLPGEPRLGGIPRKSMLSLRGILLRDPTGLISYSIQQETRRLFIGAWQLMSFSS